jgi:hypothetical protein
MNKSIVKRAEEAHKRREAFIELHTKSRLLELKLIYEIWKNKDWNVLGFKSFREYCEAPEPSGGLGISPAWGVQLAETYHKFVKELKVKEKDILEIGARKLYQIRKLVTKENLEDWLFKAKTLTLADLNKEIKNIDDMACQHEWSELKRCVKCGIWQKVDKN